MDRIASGVSLVAAMGSHTRVHGAARSETSSETSAKSTSRRSNAEAEAGERMAKLLRERSTAQKRRQSKREELTKLGGAIQELEARIARQRAQVDALSEQQRQLVYLHVANRGTPPIGCRLCSILDRREDFVSVERLLHHFRAHHVSDIRQKGDDFVLEVYATEIPTEEAIQASDNEDNDSDNEDSPEEQIKSPQMNSVSEMKRKLRLKRNAASARKSRKRKRVQLERWRMIFPMLRFEAESLEEALTAVASNPVACNNSVFIAPPTASPVSPHSVYSRYEAEPDVVSAAYALIGCYLSAPRVAT